MKRLINILILVVMLTATAVPSISAQKNGGESRPRKEWVKEFRNYKKDYLTRKLKLSAQQSEQFFPVYFQMEDEMIALQRQLRQMVRDLEKKGNNASALETDKTIEAIFEQKSREGEIEMKYLPKFRAILTPAQMLQLKKSEQRLTRELMKFHGKKKKKD